MKKRLFCVFLISLYFAFSTAVSAMDLSDIAALEGSNERVRLGIMKFTSKTYEVPDERAAAISDFFARLLFKADDIMLVERERLDDAASELRLGMSGLVDPRSAAAIGKIAGAEYVLLGSITNLGHAQSAGFVPLPFVSVATSQQKVKADLDIRVVKVETGEIVCAEAASGTSSQSSTGLATSWFGVYDSGFGGIEGNAIFNAAAQLAPKIQKSVTGKDTLAQVLAEEFKKASKSSKTKEEKKTASTKKRTTASKTKKDKKDEAVQEAPINTASVAEAVETAEAPSATSVKSAKEFENESTDPAKVIRTYGLPSGEANVLRIAHTNANKLGDKSSKAYDKYVELANSNSIDYLAAYRAGVIAKNLGKKNEAAQWFDKALEINPNYEPAKQAKENINSAPSSSKAKSSKRKK